MNGLVCAIHTSNERIWIPPNGRPYWTRHNKRGNAGPHLTDDELGQNGLSAYLEFPFDEVWAEAHRK